MLIAIRWNKKPTIPRYSAHPMGSLSNAGPFRVAKKDPIKINGKPMTRPKVIGSLKTSTPRTTATAGLM